MLKDDSGAFRPGAVGNYKADEEWVLRYFAQHPRNHAQWVEREGHVPGTAFQIDRDDSIAAIPARKGGTIVTVKPVPLGIKGEGRVDRAGGSSIRRVLEVGLCGRDYAIPLPGNTPFCTAGADFVPVASGAQGQFSRVIHNLVGM
tara:strand:+ start:37736 stop:38170 length:435 start_codon:yes stop_codon:yes gene_type:complete